MSITDNFLVNFVTNYTILSALNDDGSNIMLNSTFIILLFAKKLTGRLKDVLCPIAECV